MTGLDPRVDRVIEVCLQRVRGSVDEAEVTSLVAPDCGTFGNVHVHGISPEELAGAPSFAAIAPQIEAILDGAILVAHAAAWDATFLEAELARAGRPRR